jgi:hypothetical protein
VVGVVCRVMGWVEGGGVEQVRAGGRVVGGFRGVRGWREGVRVVWEYVARNPGHFCFF